MTTYQLSSKKISGTIKITYLKGLLNRIEIDLQQPMTAEQWQAFVQSLCYYENVDLFISTGFTVNKQAGTNEKIALFCRLYKQFIGIAYTVSGADAGKMKNLNVDENLLTHYFQSENFLFKGKQSISNLLKYFNELRAEIANKNKSKHPNYWSLEYENKLQPAQQAEYWKHLRNLGLQPKKDRVGKTIGWEPVLK